MRTKISTLGLSSKSIKTPWHLRLAPTVKGIISFVQNLLPSRTPKEASAAAILAGIGLLTAPMEQAQAAVSKVTEVITNWDIMTPGFFNMEVVHSSGSGAQWASPAPKYCWSGIYQNLILAQWGLPPWQWINAENYQGDNSGQIHTIVPSQDQYYYPNAFHYDYLRLQDCCQETRHDQNGQIFRLGGSLVFHGILLPEWLLRSAVGLCLRQRRQFLRSGFDD